MRVLVAVDEPHGADLAAGLEAEGLYVVGVVPASALASAVDRAPQGADEAARVLADADAVVLESSRATLSASVVAVCDRRAVRIVPLADGPADERIAAAFGLEPPLPLAVEAWLLAERLAAPPSARASSEAVRATDIAPKRPSVIAVWGPAGSPGRSTIAIELAVELSRGGRHVGLVDADSHAPSIALALGLADEAPGFAAACRQSELGGLDSRELARISAPIGSTGVDVLTGLNRPSRWPELRESRVASALAACREWADHTVVDVAASLERDEEIVSDLEGPRRNAATLAALRSADLVVAVAAADPLGVSRFLRAYPELRATIGATPVAVVANRLRPGALGIDARGQVRRTLDRFGGITDVWFVPADVRAADAALLAARPIADVAPRSPITLAVRRFVGEAVAPVPESARGIRRRSRRRAPEPALS
ncbi:MinD-like ATPase involved in chromosome partitioning or flagellar assembly [Microbacterium sp. cf046]|uniref:AAA family ATPase n=1 Tax=Microbacterium sp. cf046 TaxID=1761803 RepID=UPI0008F2EAD6|nr:P-loop NTPase [Microbacterium sp. cf046]SFR99597.1 MinD-like ATPase involved in chromosome partitioning or flagellar assembly [Microbacterium sp. cf046]